MAASPLHTLLRHIRQAAGPPGEGPLTDAQLLERWTGQRDEAAFARLLRRHGPAVLGACQRLLRDPHEAEDAFQATFLVLVRRAGSIRRREALAAWLHRVACRVALRARAAAARRRSRERTEARLPAVAAPDQTAGRDLQAVLDEEIDHLPEHYRPALSRCCLEGRSYAEASRDLGRPLGTVASWVARARERLRVRL